MVEETVMHAMPGAGQPTQSAALSFFSFDFFFFLGFSALPLASPSAGGLFSLSFFCSRGRASQERKSQSQPQIKRWRSRGRANQESKSQSQPGEQEPASSTRGSSQPPNAAKPQQSTRPLSVLRATLH